MKLIKSDLQGNWGGLELVGEVEPEVIAGHVFRRVALYCKCGKLVWHYLYVLSGGHVKNCGICRMKTKAEDLDDEDLIKMKKMKETMTNKQIGEALGYSTKMVNEAFRKFINVKWSNLD